MNDFKVEWLLCVKVKEYLGSPCLNLSPVTVSSTQPFPQWVKSARASQIHLPFIHPQIYKSFCLSSVLLRAKKRVDLLIHLYRLLKVNCCRWNLSGHTLGSGLCVRCSFYFIKDQLFFEISSPGFKSYFELTLIHYFTNVILSLNINRNVKI